MCSGRCSSAEVGEFADRWAKLSTNRNRLDVLTNHSRLGYWGEGLYSDIDQQIWPFLKYAETGIFPTSILVVPQMQLKTLKKHYMGYLTFGKHSFFISKPLSLFTSPVLIHAILSNQTHTHRPTCLVIHTEVNGGQGQPTPPPSSLTCGHLQKIALWYK